MWELLREALLLCSGMLLSSGMGDGVGVCRVCLGRKTVPPPQPRPPSSWINDVCHFLYESFLKFTSWKRSNKNSLPFSFNLVIKGYVHLQTKVSQHPFLDQTDNQQRVTCFDVKRNMLCAGQRVMLKLFNTVKSRGRNTVRLHACS